MYKQRLLLKETLIEEHYEDLEELCGWENEDGARWHDVGQMLEYKTAKELIESLDLSLEEVEELELA